MPTTSLTFAGNFGVTGYPTIQFISPRGVPLERIVGKKPGHQVMMAMQAALQNVAPRRGCHNIRDPLALVRAEVARPGVARSIQVRE